MQPKDINRGTQDANDKESGSSAASSAVVSLTRRISSKDSEHFNDVDKQTNVLLSKKLDIMSSYSTLAYLPDETLLQILKSMPDMGALQAMILTCKHFNRLFRSRREEVMFSVLLNDVGKDVVMDYMQIDILTKLPEPRGLSDVQYGLDLESQLLKTFDHRKALSMPTAFKNFSEAHIVYVAQHAHWVRRITDELIRDVLFGPAIPGKGCKSANPVHHKFLDHISDEFKTYSNFDMATLKQGLDASELHRFKRGIHRLQICRLLGTGGFEARGASNKLEPSAWNPGRKRVFVHLRKTTEKLPRPEMVRAAQLAKWDSMFQFHSGWQGITVFILSLPPWEREEMAACAKLVARGYALAARRASVRSRPYSVARMHDVVLFHFEPFCKALHYAPAFHKRIRETQMKRKHKWYDPTYTGHSPLLWEMLFELARFVTHDDYTMDEHLLRPKVSETQSWVTRGSTAGLHADRYESEAPPLYRAMVDLALSNAGHVNKIPPQQFVEDCWVMWSNPARLRAWPRWKQLAETMESIDKNIFGPAMEKKQRHRSKPASGSSADMPAVSA